MPRAPLPDRPVRGSRTGKPIMAALDLLGRRWALRVVWELHAGPSTFRDLRARCDDLSPTSLNTRLGELRDAGLVDALAEDGYRLTPLGEELVSALGPLADWSKRWARHLKEPRGRGE